MTTRGTRALRGTLAAVVAVFVAALFHAASGGGAPSALALTLSLAFSVPTCVLLTGTRLSLWRLCVSVGVSQLIFHGLFALGAGGTTVEAGTSTMGAHLHATTLLIAPVAPGAPAAPTHDMSSMWLGHVAAAIVTVAALRHGETVASRLCTLAAAPVLAAVERLALRSEPADAVVQVVVSARPITLPVPALLLGALRHRGPPVGAALAE